MAGNFYNNNDSLDINELAALNNDISDDMLEKLSQQVAMGVQQNDNDAALFEEPKETAQETSQDEGGYEDDFMRKFKAKKNKAAASQPQTELVQEPETIEKTADEEIPAEQVAETEQIKEPLPIESSQELPVVQPPTEPIEQVTKGNIIEKAVTQEQLQYNDSLDYLDGNVKYSKYVVYVDPQNVDFMESLTVKERKNLINSILREQDDIGITKQRYKKMQTVITHVVVAILTVAISIPIIYYTINASLEASINNYRRSQTNFQTLYRENGKITNKN